ncbi:MAG: AraC family transcriptional regulator [Bacteroidia bacterium]|nr:AraC family transcriptional regulator [Bacteroidia bacterium]
MGNRTQLARYKKLLSFIDIHFKEDINIPQIEEVCHYSYRNINRIFEALHNETIGKYVKRLRLEKAAQYLSYSEMGVSEIAYEVGFEDRAAFSKAFKNKYQLSPANFRKTQSSIREELQSTLVPPEQEGREELEFEIAYLDDFTYLFLEYRGLQEDMSANDKVWEDLYEYGNKKGIISEAPIFMLEIRDDEEISDSIHCRYNFALLLENKPDFEAEGLFRIKEHKQQKYARFTHVGAPESSIEFYRKIYAYWMQDVGLELQDLPSLEFYPNYAENLPEEELQTEIYIPVV